MHFDDFEWNEENVLPGSVWVRVDLARQMLSVFQGGHETGTAVILYGTDGHPTPLGTFRYGQGQGLLVAQLQWTYALCASPHHDGVVIHTSNVERGYATHGCVDVPPGFARRLFAAVAKGDLVVMADETGGGRATGCLLAPQARAIPIEPKRDRQIRSTGSSSL